MARLASAEEQIGRVLAGTQPNHGESLRDVVHKAVADIAEIKTDQAALRAQVEILRPPRRQVEETPIASSHIEREDEPWAIDIPDRPRRAESAEYAHSRKAMNAIAALDPAFSGSSRPVFCVSGLRKNEAVLLRGGHLYDGLTSARVRLSSSRVAATPGASHQLTCGESC
jgi:hypothetical protein